MVRGECDGKAKAVEKLDKLLNDPIYKIKARVVGRQVRSENGTQAACDAISGPCH